MTARIIPLRTALPDARPTSRRGFWPVFRSILARVAAAEARYREYRYLKEMDDRMLRDIGVTRAEAEAALRRTNPWRSRMPWT